MRVVRASRRFCARYGEQAHVAHSHLDTLMVQRGAQSFGGELSGAISVAHLYQLKGGHLVAVIFDEELEGVHSYGDRPCIPRTPRVRSHSINGNARSCCLSAS